MSLLKFGSRGNQVKELQKYLGIEADGIYGRMTEAAVKNWQLKNDLHPSGIVEYEMFESIFAIDISTDFNEQRFMLPSSHSIIKYYLPRNEYVEGPTKKRNIFIHHTGGWNNPYNQIDQWANDKRGRIGTTFIIGGPNPVNGDISYDGTILQCFDEEDWAFHLGVSRFNRKLDGESIGIELCNFGPLEKKAGEYYTWAGQRVQKGQVVTLSKKFRGYKHWHRYSQNQLDALKHLILYLSMKYDIDINIGLKSWIQEDVEMAFDFHEEVLDGKINGLFTHTNVKPWPTSTGNKFDCSPQPAILNMIKDL